MDDFHRVAADIAQRNAVEYYKASRLDAPRLLLILRQERAAHYYAKARAAMGVA